MFVLNLAPVERIVGLKSVYFVFKTSRFLDLTTKLISFLGNPLYTLHTKEKLFFEKGVLLADLLLKNIEQYLNSLNCVLHIL